MEVIDSVQQTGAVVLGDDMLQDTSAVPPLSVPADRSRELSINVSVRVRPFTAEEESNLIKVDPEHIFLGDGSLNQTSSPHKHSILPRGIRKIIDVVDDKMLIFDPPETNPVTKMHRKVFPATPNSRIREHRFVFDRLFDTGTTQLEVFEATTKPLLDSILDGFNATVFAYGATGCGKTHTILGTPDDPGIIFLTMQELYTRIEELRHDKTIEVSLSFLEIYNESIRDLLDPKTSSRKLTIREDARKRITVSNLSTHTPNSVEDVMQLILAGNRNRTSSPTEANATSSRSHAVLQINVTQRDRSVDISQEHTFATLSIIDLAGSERASATKNRGVRLNEGANINKSLLALGNCINALCDPRKRNHIPYRDSKLTRLLKFSLGGNCKTVMIVCVSPLSLHYDETLNTLKYADRAKEIKTKLIRNQHNLDRHVGSYLKMITQQKLEIEELKARQDVAINTALDRQQRLFADNYRSIVDSISSLNTSIQTKTQDKWRRYFVLAKRKIMLHQRTEFEAIKDLIDVSLNSTVNSLIDQVLTKLIVQILQLEAQYKEANEIDHMLQQTGMHSLKRLQEQDGWTATHTDIFNNELTQLRSAYDNDILFNSSVLYDHLIMELSPSSFSPLQFVLLYNATMSAEDQVAVVIQAMESLVNGDFDTLLEEKSFNFMQSKLREQDGLGQKRSTSPPMKVALNKTKKKKSYTFNRKVHFDHDTSDVSYDDSTMIKSDLDEESPVQANILDKLDDELPLRFNPTLNSPPSLKKPQATAITKRARPKRISSLKRQEEAKLPLLNKQASKLVPSASPKSPWRGTSDPVHLIQFQQNTATRSLDSHSSDRVE